MRFRLMCRRDGRGVKEIKFFLLMISNYVVDGINQFMKGDNSPSLNGMTS